MKGKYTVIEGKHLFKGVLLADYFYEDYPLIQKIKKVKKLPLYKDTITVDPEYMKYPVHLRDNLFVENGKWTLTPRGEELLKIYNERQKP